MPYRLHAANEHPEVRACMPACMPVHARAPRRAPLLEHPSRSSSCPAARWRSFVTASARPHPPTCARAWCVHCIVYASRVFPKPLLLALPCAALALPAPPPPQLADGPQLQLAGQWRSRAAVHQGPHSVQQVSCVRMCIFGGRDVAARASSPMQIAMQPQRRTPLACAPCLLLARCMAWHGAGSQVLGGSTTRQLWLPRRGCCWLHAL